MHTHTHVHTDQVALEAQKQGCEGKCAGRESEVRETGRREEG